MVFVAVLCGYVAMAWLSTKLAGTHNNIAGLWAPNVVMFALLLRNPRLQVFETWAAILTGAFAANLLKGSGVLPSATFAVFATAYVGLLVTLALRMDKRERHDQSWPFRAIFVPTLVATAMLGFSFGLTTNLLFGWEPLRSGLQIAFANLVGAALFLPFAMNMTGKRLVGLTHRESAVKLVCWLAICAGTMVIAQAYSEYAFAYLILPMMFAAIRLPPLPMATVCMTTGIAGILVAVNGHVFNLPDTDAPITPSYQFAVAVAVVLPYFVCLLIGQILSTRRRLIVSEERFRRAVDEAPVGIMSIDLTGRIVECNPALAAMLGYSRAEVEGHQVQDFSLPEDIEAGAEFRRKAGTGQFKTFTLQKRYRRKDGSIFWVEISASHIRDTETGQVILISQVTDIDARKKMERDLVQLKDQWQFALANAGQGFWDHNEANGTLTYSQTWTSMLGYEPGEMDNNENLWLGLIHPEDRPSVEAMDAEHRAGTISFFEHEYRMRHKSGHWLWILDRGKVIERGASGNVLRMIGTLTDISHRKSIEENLEQTAGLLAREKERLRVTLESIGDAVICTDVEGCITFMNPEAERLTGALAEDGIGQPLSQIYATHVDTSGGANLIRHDGQTQWHGSQLQRSDGVKLTIREVTSPILSNTGSVEGNVIVFQDFSEMRRMQRELEHAALHDDLTGLVNRVGFLDAIERLRHRALFDGSEHQLLYIDLDRFKHVNDTAGHAAGDAMLKLVSKALRETVRSGDIVARLGGDEFAVILPSCPQSYARLASHAIVEQIGSIELDWSGQLFKIGASVGGATLDSGSDSIDDVIAEADAACYVAKATGRVSGPANQGNAAKVSGAA